MDEGHPLNRSARVRLRRLAGIATLALLCAVPLRPLSARIFWGTGGAPETAGVLAPDPSWTRAYGTMLRINGGRGGLEVWHGRMAVDDAAAQLIAQIRAAGGAAWFTGGGELAWGIGCIGNRVHRYLIGATDAPNQCHVYQLSQDLADFNASLKPPTEHLMKGAPAHPESTPRSFFALEDSGLQMATAASGDQPVDVQSAYARLLSTRGWRAPLQPGKGVDLYLREREVLLVRAESAGEGGGSLIILIHKPLGAKPPG